MPSRVTNQVRFGVAIRSRLENGKPGAFTINGRRVTQVFASNSFIWAMNGSEDLHQKIIDLKLRCGSQKQVSTLNLWLELALTISLIRGRNWPKSDVEIAALKLCSPCLYPPDPEAEQSDGFVDDDSLSGDDSEGDWSWLARCEMGRSWPSVSLQWMLLRSTGGSLSVTVV